jgi:hypothetical protein
VGHEHATRPPTPGELEVVGYATFHLIVEGL